MTTPYDATLTPYPPKDVQDALRRVRTEARRVRDEALANLCNAALLGDPRALEACAPHLTKAAQ